MRWRIGVCYCRFSAILNVYTSQAFEPQERTIRLSLSGARQKADEARAVMQQSQSRGKVLDGLIRLRDSGDVKGIQVNIW